MKTITASFVLVLASATAHANADVDRLSYCSNFSSMLKSIAAWRDQGASPEKTLGLMSGVKGVALQQKKDAINAVYFDKAFANSRGTEFGNQVRLNCLAEKSR